MSKQLFPYNPALAAHFINLALAAEAQFVWEYSGEDHPMLEDPFQIPLECYDKIFAASKVSGQSVKECVEGPIQAEYEFLGSIRFGQQPVPDYEVANTWSTLSQVQDLEALLELMTTYSRHLSESITNTVLYNRSNPLMGFALRSTNDGHGVIVLRGTMTTEEWLNNINYRLRPFLRDSPEYGRVHNGFRDIYKGVRGRYWELADQIEPTNLLFLVGHSLGAAVSMLGAFDLVLQRPEHAPKVQAYLFGSPRIGDNIFSESYNRLVRTSYRIVNVCDVVPYIPFEEINTVADVLSYPYADTKGEVAYVHQCGNPIANHVGSYHIATQRPISDAPAGADFSNPRWLAMPT